MLAEIHVLDIDHTLIDADRRLSASTQHYLRKESKILMLATGRGVDSVRMELSSQIDSLLSIQSNLIIAGNNGASIIRVDSNGTKVIKDKVLAPEIAIACAQELIRDPELGVSIATWTNVEGQTSVWTDIKGLPVVTPAAKAGSVRIANEKVHDRNRSLEVLIAEWRSHPGLGKISLIVEPNDQLLDAILGFSDSHGVAILPNSFLGHTVFDIFPATASKHLAIQQVLAEVYRGQEAALVAGDGLVTMVNGKLMLSNDATMLLAKDHYQERIWVTHGRNLEDLLIFYTGKQLEGIITTPNEEELGRYLSTRSNS